MLILDACRADALRDRVGFPGTFGTKHSRGSATTEFLRATFTGEQLHDTVYVTANPQLYRIENGIYGGEDPIDVEFHAQWDIWQDNWDDDLRTIRPEVVVEKALEASESFPEKRLIVHFVQPHAPFLGPTAREHFSGESLSFDWEGHRDVPEEVIWQAYCETLDAVLDELPPLIKGLEGKTVITADHGEAIGDRGFPIPAKVHGHPPHVYINPLVKVPWFELEHESRKHVVPEAPVGRLMESDRETVNERLTDLGYMDSPRRPE